MNIEILPIKPEHSSIFYKVLCSFMSDGLGFPEEALHYFRNRWTIDVIEQAAIESQYVILGAWEGERIVGLLLGTPPEGGVGTIIWVLVAREYQRKGIGRQLFEEACERYRNMDGHKVKLTVPNKETVRFYEKLGMSVEGEHRNHWWHVDIWSMGKTL